MTGTMPPTSTSPTASVAASVTAAPVNKKASPPTAPVAASVTAALLNTRVPVTDSEKATTTETVTTATPAVEQPVLSIAMPTNGVTYFVGFAKLDLATMRPDLLPYLPLFCTALGSMSTQRSDYRTLAQRMEAHTGGIDFAPSLTIHHTNLPHFRGGVYFSSYCLDSNLDHMFDLFQEILTETVFGDVDRLRSLINLTTSSIQDSVVESGHVFARLHAAAPFSIPHELKELWNGLAQKDFMQMLAQQADLAPTIQALKEIWEIFGDVRRLRFRLVGEERTIPVAKTKLGRLARNLHLPSPTPLPSLPTDFEECEWRTETDETTRMRFVGIPASVNFVAKTIPIVPYTHPDYPKLRVLGSLLSGTYLHNEIREKGGAYGAGASVGDGLWSFYSYRDPNSQRTLDIYSYPRISDWLTSSSSSSSSNQKADGLTDRNLEEAKIKLFSEIDHPVPPSGRGSTEFVSDITYPMRQQQREALFSTSRQDLLEVAERYLKEDHLINVQSTETETGKGKGIGTEKGMEKKKEGKVKLPGPSVAILGPFLEGSEDHDQQQENVLNEKQVWV